VADGWCRVADGVTHLASAYLLRAPAGGRHVPVFVLGAVLPDLVSRVPALAAEEAVRQGVPVPQALVWCWTPLHLPAGILLVSLLLPFLFAEEERPAVCCALLGGGALHVALDLLQRHVGLGYLLLFPFSSRDFEVGLLGSEATVWAAPLLAAAAALLWGFRRRAAARRAGDVPRL
jgi:hypothetical protein